VAYKLRWCFRTVFQGLQPPALQADAAVPESEGRISSLPLFVLPCPSGKYPSSAPVIAQGRLIAAHVHKPSELWMEPRERY